MDDVLANNLMATINRALRDRRYSASRASTEAGSPDLVRNIRRGRMPSLERLNALCEVLDLDFYVGPRRHAGAIDVRRLREAIASTERTLGAHGIALQLEARADAIAAVYDLLDRDRAPATAERVRELIEALGRVAGRCALSGAFGPRLPPLRQPRTGPPEGATWSFPEWGTRGYIRHSLLPAPKVSLRKPTPRSRREERTARRPEGPTAYGGRVSANRSRDASAV